MADPVRDQQHFTLLCFTGADGVFRVWCCDGQSELQRSGFTISRRTQAMDFKSVSTVTVVSGLDDLATESDVSLRSNVGRALPENQTLESVDILDQRQYLVHWIFLQLFTTADSAGFLVGGFKMKRWLTLTLLATLAMMAQTVFAKTLEVEVHGMTCAFCVDSLERKLTAMPSVAKVQVSLKANKVRLETDGNTPSIETIKQAILDAGFTPVKVTVISDEKNKE